jgi:hypothetical protein
MADTFGLSFAPLPNGPDQPQTPSQGAYGGSVSPVQQAIQILSLRRPRTWGAGAPAPPALLSGTGGSQGVPDLPALLRTLMQHLQGPGVGPGSMNGPTSGGPLAGVFGTPAGMPTVPNAQAPTPGFEFINPTDPTPPLYQPGEEEQNYTPPSAPTLTPREPAFRGPRQKQI